MTKTIAILIFDGAEEMDFVGPFEVFGAAVESVVGWQVVTVAASRQPITCEKSLRVIPDRSYDEIQEAEVVIIPGGSGARREIDNPRTIGWLKELLPRCQWMASVCTGAFLLAGSGIGRRLTTHHRFVERLRTTFPVEVVENVRFIQDGKLVSAAGVMSGIEMSLWLVERLWGSAVLEQTKDYIAYDHPPRAAVSLDFD